MHAYNVLRHKGEADLYCAVPENVPLPEFVTDEQGEYARPRAERGQPRPRHAGPPATYAELLLLLRQVEQEQFVRPENAHSFRQGIPQMIRPSWHSTRPCDSAPSTRSRVTKSLATCTASSEKKRAPAEAPSGRCR
jgi:hypothetical protein